MKFRSYPLHQCALYKLSSKGRLAHLVELDHPRRLADLLAPTAKQYSEFKLDSMPCPFTEKARKARYVENPIEVLKRIQRRLTNLLARIEAPTWAHGAVRGKSYRSNAAAHRYGDKCATFDVRSFFPSTSESRVFNFFRDKLLCEPDIAGVLTRVVCHRGRLPTGAPTSPIVSIWANLPMFEALASIAERHGLTFTVYIDDITFSGKCIPSGLTAMVKAVVEQNGHKLAEDKTCYFGKGVPKRITGVVVAGGDLRVPHERFRKARRIRAALVSARSPEARLHLVNRLQGLAGEAAFLDARFIPQKLRVIELARAIRSELSDGAASV